MNSVAISTLDPSTDPVTRFPAPLVPAATANGEPLPGVAVKDCPFWLCSASGALKVTSGICAIVSGLAVVVVDDDVAVGLGCHARETAGRYAILCQAKQAVGGPGKLGHTRSSTVSSQIEVDRLIAGTKISGETQPSRPLSRCIGTIGAPASQDSPRRWNGDGDHARASARVLGRWGDIKRASSAGIVRFCVNNGTIRTNRFGGGVAGDAACGCGYRRG